MENADRTGTDDLQIGNLLRRAYRTHARAVNAALQPVRMTAQSFVVLDSLSSNNGLDQTALSRELHVEKAALTSTLRQLINDGFIRRTADSEDGRRQLVFLTKKGADFLVKNRPKLHHVRDRATAGISAADLRKLVLTLEKVIVNIDTHLDE
ncbi:MAG TPA: MarR family transcriptional regulator [Sphingobium sp.]